MENGGIMNHANDSNASCVVSSTISEGSNIVQLDAISQNHAYNVTPDNLARVDIVLERLRRKGRIYMALGFIFYIGGSLSLLWFIENKGTAAILQMILFQAMLIYVFTKEMYPAIRGAFEVGLIANRQAIPAMERLASVMEKVEPLVADSELKRKALDLQAEVGKLRGEVGRLADSLNSPIVPAMPKPK